MTESEKNHLVKELAQKTGFSERRCKNYFERFNWNKEKVYNYSAIKSSMRNETSLFEEDVVEEKKTSPDTVKKAKRGRKPKQKAEENKKESKGTSDEHFQTRITKDGCIEYDVEIINGEECFRGKAIKMNSSGFYHPFASMEEINKWTNTFLKKK